MIQLVVVSCSKTNISYFDIKCTYMNDLANLKPNCSTVNMNQESFGLLKQSYEL
jgi:hypothetical protein